MTLYDINIISFIFSEFYLFELSFIIRYIINTITDMGCILDNSLAPIPPP